MTAPPLACRLTHTVRNPSFGITRLREDTMTISKWLTLASAVALLGGVACSDNGRSRGTGNTASGSTSTTGSTNDNSSPTGAAPNGTAGTSASSSPEGRRGPVLPRARMDGGTDLGSSSGTSGSLSNPSTGTDSTSGTSSGSNADQTAPATGTTPGNSGQTPS